MFGYIRPDKGELLVREFSRFRAVYCGICKEISRSYGQLPRVSLTYDITMLGLLLLSLSDENPKERMESCILNPVQKKPILESHPLLHRCAAYSVLLAGGKFRDEIQDGKPVTGHLGHLLFRSAEKKAAKEYPEEAAVIRKGLEKMRETELAWVAAGKDLQAFGPVPAYETAASQFGGILQDVFRASFLSYFTGEKYRESLLEGLSRLGFDFGRWIFTLDAIDDYEEDVKAKNWNPFIGIPIDKAKETACEMLTACEQEMDRIAALLPYTKDANILSNIIQKGLPATRHQIFLGQKLRKL